MVRVCHRRAGLNLVSAVSNRGALRWMVLDGAVNAAALIRFLQRLIRDVRRKVFLVLDRLQVHRAGEIRDWLAAHRTKIEVFYLPAYSPELNPDEGLNADRSRLSRASPRPAANTTLSAASSATCAGSPIAFPHPKLLPPRARPLRRMSQDNGGRINNGVRERWIVEHIRALELEGADDIDNLGPAHEACATDKTREDHRRAAHPKRQKIRHTGADASKRPLPFGKGSPWKRTLSGQIVPRG